MRYYYTHYKNRSVKDKGECHWESVSHVRAGRDLKIVVKEGVKKPVRRPKFTYTFSAFDTTSSSAYRPFEIARLKEIFTNLISACQKKYYNKPKMLEHVLIKTPYVLLADDEFRATYARTIDGLVAKKQERLAKKGKSAKSINGKITAYSNNLNGFLDWKTEQVKTDKDLMTTTYPIIGKVKAIADGEDASTYDMTLPSSPPSSAGHDRTL